RRLTVAHGVLAQEVQAKSSCVKEVVDEPCEEKVGRGRAEIRRHALVGAGKQRPFRSRRGGRGRRFLGQGGGGEGEERGTGESAKPQGESDHDSLLKLCDK